MKFQWRKLGAPDSNIQLYSIIFNYIQLYSIIFKYIQLYSIIFNYIQLYSIIFNYIQLYSNIFNYIQLYSIIFNYIQLYSIIFNYQVSSLSTFFTRPMALAPGCQWHEMLHCLGWQELWFALICADCGQPDGISQEIQWNGYESKPWYPSETPNNW